MGEKGASESRKVTGGYQPKPVQKGHSPKTDGGKPTPKPPTGGSGVGGPPKSG